ncbi:MAG: CinA family protein [Burkholderiales bacterium]|nr:CinA family protein [Burkholderiales bacterium]
MEKTSFMVGEALKARGYLLVTAESCTGGWVGEVLTSIAGSSEWYERGFITYSNLAKREMLGVNPDTLKEYGAVSEETAREMAVGAIRHSHADVALAITGIAGPGGGSEEKPVGTVCFGWVLKGEEPVTKKVLFEGSREEIRRQAVRASLEGLLRILG